MYTNSVPTSISHSLFIILIETVNKNVSVIDAVKTSVLCFIINFVISNLFVPTVFLMKMFFVCVCVCVCAYKVYTKYTLKIPYLQALLLFLIPSLSNSASMANKYSVNVSQLEGFMYMQCVQVEVCTHST